MSSRMTPEYIAAIAIEILRQQSVKEEKDRHFNYSQGSPWRHNRYAGLVLDKMIDDINNAVNAIFEDEKQ